ncbi:MAG TPA: S41 family peptidase [Gaiellaceae bacterium]
MSRSRARGRAGEAAAVPLADFLARVQPLSLASRYVLVAQAQAIIEGLYVHLRLKRAMHAVDPVQRLRLLARRLESMSDLQFHAELGGVFRSLRDLHTTYQLPDPYRGHVATLGFLVERYFDEADKPHYVISKAERDLAERGLRPGSEVVAWNAVPIERAVELNAERQAGSNASARIARGLEAMTLRPLRTTLPPDEEWVTVGFRPPRGGNRELRVHWLVYALPGSGGRAQDPVPTAAVNLGIDLGREATRHVKRALFATTKARVVPPQDLHAVLRFETVRSGRTRYGYVRIFSFNVTRARYFLEAMGRALARLPQNGLIIDIRGNPGGHIPAAEGLLQLLTDRPVTPVRFSMTTTPTALSLCDATPELAPWRDSIAASVETGEAYSQGFFLSNPAELAAELPRYLAPKVLILDALCYSAADIFAAGFQDNRIGTVLGTDEQSGAGGANVWTHDLLRVWLPQTLGALDGGAGFRVALRRATRTGVHDGVPLEDLGVTADQVHRLKKLDLTSNNEDLKRTAVEILQTAEREAAAG